jgi:4-hydroxy-tetrahydrodipicolinate synthase
MQDAMTTGRLAGTWYLVPTAFDAAGELDVASQSAIVDAAIAWGVDGLTVMGVMSEPASLADWERDAALAAVFDAAAGRVPVVVGCSAGAATRAAGLTARARELGAVAAMVAAPPLLRNVDGLPAYFARVAREGGLPLLLQDEPAATGVLVPASVLIAATVACDTVGIKVEDPPTPAKISRLLELDPTLALFGGLGGVAALWELRRGAAGTMTGFAFPEAMRAMRVAGAEGRWADAARIFDRFLPLVVFEAQVGVGLAIRKEVLRRRGVLQSNISRGPVRHVDAAMSDELDDLFERTGVRPGPERLDVAALVGPGESDQVTTSR